MRKEVFEIDSSGYITEKYAAEFDDDGNLIEEVADNIIITQPPDGLYRAKWAGSEWVEDMPQAEIDSLNNQPQTPAPVERLEALELAMLAMMELTL